MSKSTERFSLYGDERKDMTEAEEAYQLHSTAMNPDYRLQPVIGQNRKRQGAQLRHIDRPTQPRRRQPRRRVSHCLVASLAALLLLRPFVCCVARALPDWCVVD